MADNGNKTALITGATSGIGAAFARRFASEGYDLIITGRREDKIKKLADELLKTYHVNVEVIIIELSNYDEVEKLVAQIKNRNIDVLINNAGFGTRDYFYEEDLKSQEEMIHVHVLCPMRLVHALLPDMIQRGKGTIINVSSAGAFLILPKNATYAGSKSFLKVFSETLHLELMGTGIRVQALCPGFTKTDFHEKMGMEKSRQVSKGIISWMSSEEVVDFSLKCLKKNKVVCIPGLLNRILVLVATVLPNSIYYKIAYNFWSKKLGKMI